MYGSLLDYLNSRAVDKAVSKSYKHKNHAGSLQFLVGSTHHVNLQNKRAIEWHTAFVVSHAKPQPPLPPPYTHYVLRNQILLTCLACDFLHTFAVSTVVQQFTARSFPC